jgi:three-Cys-motif partner protein
LGVGVSDPDGLLWKKDPHTQAKHDIYERYFDAWFPILLQSNFGPKGVTYAEGYSGPGEYLGQNPASRGSPLIALDAALRCRAAPSPARPARFLLVEKNEQYLNHLKGRLLKRLGTLDPVVLARRGLTVDLVCGACSEEFIPLLVKHAVWNKPLIAIFDTWGSAVEFSILQRVARSRAAEAIVTMQPASFFRFASDPKHYGDSVFGPVVWRDVQRQPSNQKADYIRSQYRRVLNEAGFGFVLDFQLADEKNNLLYLVYGTNSDKGVEKMKDAIWRADPYQGLGYRDPRDPNQETLPIKAEPLIGPLCRLIHEHLLGLPGFTAPLDELRRFVLLETIFRPGQTLRAVQRLIGDKKATTNPNGTRLIGTSLVTGIDVTTLF